MTLTRRKKNFKKTSLVGIELASRGMDSIFFILLTVDLRSPVPAEHVYSISKTLLSLGEGSTIRRIKMVAVFCLLYIQMSTSGKEASLGTEEEMQVV